MKRQATELRTLETIDIMNYTFKRKPKGAGLSIDKKFLVSLRISVAGKQTAFLSCACMDLFFAQVPNPRVSKIYDLRFPTAFFTLKKLLPNVLCDLVVGYMGPDEQTCHICSCESHPGHYLTKRHQNNIQKTNLIPEYLIQAYASTVRTLPEKKKKVLKKMNIKIIC